MVDAVDAVDAVDGTGEGCHAARLRAGACWFCWLAAAAEPVLVVTPVAAVPALSVCLDGIGDGCHESRLRAPGWLLATVVRSAAATESAGGARRTPAQPAAAAPQTAASTIFEAKDPERARMGVDPLATYNVKPMRRPFQVP
jgi:hypothetical protein